MWAFYWGFGLALQVRIGKHLGMKSLVAAKRTVLISALIVVVVVGGVSLATHMLREHIVRVFTQVRRSE